MSATADSPRHPHYRWYVVGMLWFISFFNYADRQAIFSVFPLLESEMGLSKVEQGLLGSAFAWVYGLAAPLAGVVVDRVRRKTAILVGLIIWSVICLATAVSRTFSHLFFFRAAEGLGETFYYPAANAMLSDYHGPETRSRALGLHQTSVYVGTIAGGFLAGLLAEWYGWRWSFIVFGALGIVLGGVLWRFLHEPRRGESDAPSGAVPHPDLALFSDSRAKDRPVTGDAGVMPPPAVTPQVVDRGSGHGLPEASVSGGSVSVQTAERLPLRQVFGLMWNTPAVPVLMGAFLCANFVAMVLLTWMPSFLKERFNLSLAMAGLAATVFIQLSSLVGAPLGGWLADAMRQRTPGGRAIVQAAAVFCGAPFVFVCGQTHSVGTLVAALSAWGLFKGFYDANIFAAVFDVVPPAARGTMAGLMNMFGWLGGGATAPLVIGIIAESQGLGWAISSAAVVYIAAGVLLLLAALVLLPRAAQPRA
jgi:MFS family permease